MKILRTLLSSAILATTAFGQTQVQINAQTKQLMPFVPNIVVGNGQSITAVGTGQINATNGVTPAALNGYFADPSTNIAFSASAWRTDLSLVPGTNLAQNVATVAALKALSISGFATGYLVNVQNYATANDGGGGIFYFNSASVAADNGGTVIAPNIGTGRWIRIFSNEIQLLWFGPNTVPGTTDMTAVLTAAYSAAGETGVKLRLPPQQLKITSTLTFDKLVDVIGYNRELTIIKKSGNFIGIKIGSLAGNAGESEYSDFTLLGLGGSDVSTGIEVLLGNRITLNRITVSENGNHGIHLRGGLFGTYSNIVVRSNGGDGLRIEGNTGFSGLAANANLFSNVTSILNAGKGFNIIQNASSFSASNIGTEIVCEQNGLSGFSCDDLTNVFNIYSESNGTLGISNDNYDVVLGANSIRNFITINHESFATIDLGTNNVILNVGDGRFLQIPEVQAPRVGTNSNGKTLSVVGGVAGAGASGVTGGLLNLFGGDAAGNTLGNGGIVAIKGGSAVNSGVGGLVSVSGGDGNGIGVRGDVNITGDRVLINSETDDIILQDSGTKAVSVGGTTTIPVSVGLDLQSATRVLRTNRLTTTQRDALTPLVGMIIFNTTLNRYQGYSGSAWFDGLGVPADLVVTSVSADTGASSAVGYSATASANTTHTGLAIRNTSTGSSAVSRIQNGTNASATALTIDSFSSTHAKANTTEIINQTNGDLKIGGWGTIGITSGQNGNVTVAGTLTAGSGVTQVTDASGKVLSAALNTVQPGVGGTGQTTYTNGQLLIGNTTGNTLTKATLTEGAGVTITNGTGTITVASTAAGITGLATYAAGTAYAMTASDAALDFGTTDPTITFATAGRYLVLGRAYLRYNGATYAANQTATVHLQRTNNTPAAITNGTTTATLRIISGITDSVGIMEIPPVIYTATAGDILTVYGALSATPSIGSVDASEASVVAIPF